MLIALHSLEIQPLKSTFAISFKENATQLTEETLEEIIAGNFPKLMKGIHSHFQELHIENHNRHKNIKVLKKKRES